jgi:lysophospholipase L1-like esterase
MEQGVSIADHGASLLPPARWRVSGGLLSLCAIVLVAGATFDCLEIKTQRLYVDQSTAADNQGGTVVQRFVRSGNQITPEIISSANARFSFPSRLSLPHKLLFKAVPEGECAFEVNLISHEQKRQLLSETINRTKMHSIRLPLVDGTLEFVSHGKITWLDPRVRRSFFLWPLYTVAFAGLATTAWLFRHSIGFSARAANWLTLTASVAICLALVEIILRSVAPKLPRAILEVRPDADVSGPGPRWMSSPRYRLRLRPNIATKSQWQFGDIVEEGVIARSAAAGVLHRFAVETDAEGFSNRTVRGKIDIAALGDSFTEGWVIPAAQAWPAQLEKLTDLSVQNYGVPAFGPQQELYALQDFAIKHRPHVVVLAFFAGNDLADAVAFDRWERGRRRRGDDRAEEELTGGKIAESFRNYETLYLWSAGTAAAQLLSQHQRAPRVAETTLGDAAKSEQSYFEEGMFHIAVRGRTFDFAWIPPYLFQLSTPRSQLEQSSGWKLTRKALLDLNSACAQDGARFVLMFVPSKAEVYWPLTERSIPQAELDQALDFYLAAWNELRQSSQKRRARGVGLLTRLFPPYDKTQVTVDAIRANHLAQNQMVADFCTSEKIPMLDLTTALQEKAESGTAVYFPDDGHWNATGHEIAAKELARFLKNLP